MKTKLSFPQRMKRKRESRKSIRDAVAESDRASLIPINFDPTEFEIQAFVLSELSKIRSLLVRGEVMSKCMTCVFDIVVYDQESKRPIRIIEIKKSKSLGTTRKSKRAEERKRRFQVDRYAWFGVQVDLICNLSSAKDYVSRFLGTMQTAHGVSAPSPLSIR